MAGAFNEAQKQSDEAKAAALAALARGGSGALAEHQAAQQQIAVLKQQAAEGALRRAAQIGAGAAGAELAGAAGGAGQVYDRYSQDAGRAGQIRQQAMADLAGANSQYFEQLNAARPIVEGRAKAAWDAKEAARILAEQREMQAELDRQQAREWREQDRQWKLEDRAASQAERAAKASSAGRVDSLSDSELKVRLQGAAAVQRATQPVQPPKKLAGLRLPQLSQSATARRIGVEAGLDPARVFGLVPPKAPAAKKPAATPKQGAHRADVTARVQKHASKPTALAFNDILSLTKSLPEALSTLDQTSDKELREDYGNLDREALKRWITDYYRFG